VKVLVFDDHDGSLWYGPIIGPDVDAKAWAAHPHHADMLRDVVRVTEESLDMSPGFRETRFQILRCMHPFSPDDEIERHCRYILDQSNLGQRPAWLDKPSPADLNNDLSAGITVTVAKSEAYKRAGYKCEHCGAEQNQVTPQGSVGVPIHPHHRHYRSEGDELPSDYLVLCKKCHNQEHHKFGRYVMDLYEEERRHSDSPSWIHYRDQTMTEANDPRDAAKASASVITQTIAETTEALLNEDYERLDSLLETLRDKVATLENTVSTILHLHARGKI